MSRWVGARPRKGGDLEVGAVPSTPPQVDGQPRMTLQYQKASGYWRNQALFGTITSVCLAVFLFGIIVAS